MALIAFGVEKSNHISAAGATIKIAFLAATVNKGGAWDDSNNEFTVPVSGDYFFSVTFNKEAGGAYTNDKVEVLVIRNGDINNPIGRAWASADAKHAAGAWSMLLALDVGDSISFVSDAGGDIHKIGRVYVTGFSVA